jgi:hypothetical protein
MSAKADDLRAVGVGHLEDSSERMSARLPSIILEWGILRSIAGPIITGGVSQRRYVKGVTALVAKRQTNRIALVGSIGTGVIGSLLGTLAMDVVMLAEFSTQGLPLLTYLDLIGSIFGGGIPLGALIHVLMGSFLGLVFIAPVLTINALRMDTLRRGVAVGFLIGLVSIIACVPVALLSHLPIPTVLTFMAIPHLAWGTVTGLVVAFGLRSMAESTA